MPDSRFFDSSSPMTLEQAVEITGGTIAQDQSEGKLLIKSVAPISAAKKGDITFLSNPKYTASLKESEASACIISEKQISKAPASMILIVANDPYLAYAKIASYLHNEHAKTAEISPQAFIDPTAKIGNNCRIEAGAFIGKNVKIASGCKIASGAYIDQGVEISENSTISHNCTIAHALVGKNVILHPGVRIGQDGFGFANDKGVHIKVPQLGRVIIEDHVEIGANSCVDRGAGPDTIIGSGSKIDNLVQLGHNVQTGNGCIIVSQVGVSGSTKLGDYVVLGGQVGVAGHIHIGSMSQIAAQSGVIGNVDPKSTLGGSPAVPIKQWHRQSIALKKLINKKGK